MRKLALAICGLWLSASAPAQSLPTATLTASDSFTNPGGLGQAVAISGSTAAAAAPFAENGHGSRGLVYVFTKPATSAWSDITESARLVSSGVTSFVAVSGDGSVIAANATGGINIFIRPAKGWVGAVMPTAFLTVGQPPVSWIDQGQMSSFSMNTTGTMIAAGSPTAGYKAHFHDGAYVPAVPDLGAAFVWVEPAQGWGSANGMPETSTLMPSDGVAEDAFGAAVAVAANTLAVGATGASSNRGAIYLFQKPVTGWLARSSKFVTKLTASDGRPSDSLGAFVGIGQSGALVAAATYQGCSNTPGAAYVFARPASSWPKMMSQSAKLTSSDLTGGCFGEGIAVATDLVIVGAPLSPPQTRGGYPSGSDYTFAKPADGWKDLSLPSSMVGASNFGEFGTSNSIGGRSSAVGAPVAIVDGVVAGAVYIFSD